jgi:hypothetical protein
MHVWIMRAGVILLIGTLLAALPGCGHDPNHDIDLEKARAAANRVHAPPPPGTKMEPGHGG